MGPLDGYLPYLLNRAGARIAAAFSEEVRPLGATLQTWRVLAALHERDGRRMGDLSETTSIEVSTLTRLVDNMESKGLVARRRDAADARAVTLHATPAGRRRMEGDGAGVGGVAAAGHQPLALHVVDQTGERRDLDGGGFRQVAHAAAIALVKGRQHAPCLQSGAERADLLAECRRDARAGPIQQVGQVAVERAHGVRP